MCLAFGMVGMYYDIGSNTPRSVNTENEVIAEPVQTDCEISISVSEVSVNEHCGSVSLTDAMIQARAGKQQVSA